MNPFHELNEPYLLVVPTYDVDVTEVVNDFIEYKSNQQNLVAVAGGGNRNFADLLFYDEGYRSGLQHSLGLLV